MPAPEVAVAYVSVVPEVAGFARSLRRQLSAPSSREGARAGQGAGSAFRRAFERESPGEAFSKIVSVGARAASTQAVAAGATVGMAFANAAASAAAGAGAFAAAVKPQFQEVTTAAEAYTAAQEKKAYADFMAAKAQKLAAQGGEEYTTALSEADKAATKAKEAQDQYRFALSEMPPATRGTADAFVKLKSAFKDWSDELAPTTMPVFTDLLTTARTALPSLTPLVKDAAGVISDFVATIGDGPAGSVFTTFAKNVRENAAPALSSFLQIGKNVATGFVGILNAFAPLQLKMTSGLEDMSRRFASFGAGLKDSRGFQQFLTNVQASLPGIKSALASLATTIGHIAQAFAGLGPAAFGVLGVLLRLAAALPVPVLQGLILAYTAWRVATVASSAAQAVHTAWVNRGAVAMFRQRVGVIATTVAMRGARIVILAWAVAQRILNAAMRANPIGLVITALMALGAGLVLAYKKSETFRTIVQAAWAAIKVAIRIAWAGIKVAFAALMAGLRILGRVFRWLYDKGVKPVWDWIGKKVSNTIAFTKLAFLGFKLAMASLGAKVRALYTNFVRPIWNAIGSIIKSVWNKAIRPAFNAVKTAVRLVGIGFGKAKDAIAKAWGRISSIARKPIAFIINTVYNKGIVPVWNKVAGAFGAPKLSKAPGFADGGYTGPGGKYTPAGVVHAGEFVTRKESTAAIEKNHPGALDYMNRTGRIPGFSSGGLVGQMPGYAKGGLVGQSWDWIKNAAGTAWDKVKQGAKWLKDTIKGSAKAGMESLVRPLIGRISGDSSVYKSMVTKIPKKMLTSVFDWSGKADKKLAASGVVVGGGSFKKGQRWAKTQHGKRYQWGGNGNPSWDCSGFLSAIESVIRGQRPHRRWATGSFPPGAPGWKRNARSPFMVGITNAGVGHTAGTINGVNVESRGGDGVLYGSRARSYRSPMFTSRWGFVGKKYDDGGFMQPGAGTYVNKTGKPEPVFTSGQWASIHTLAERGATAQTSGLQPGDTLVLKTEGGSFEAYVDRRADNRIKQGISKPARSGRAFA